MGIIWVWELPGCGCYLGVNITWVWVLSGCGYYLGVGITWVWVLPGCGYYLGEQGEEGRGKLMVSRGAGVQIVEVCV